MRRLPILLILPAVLSAACAGTIVRPRQPDEATLEEMKSRILELQRTAAMTRVELDRLRREVAELQERLGGRAAPAPASAPQPSAVERPAVEEEPADLGADEVIEASDLPVAALPSPRSAAEIVGGPEPPGAQEAVPPPAPAAAPEALTPEGQALYDRGYTLYHQGRYVDAEAGFRRFLQTHPRTDLSDNAQYWIGESRYARGDLPGALAAFRETVERYPQGNKVPDSLLKIADCLDGLGDVEGARAAYDEVIRRFPNAPAAAIAEERRAGLR